MNLVLYYSSVFWTIMFTVWQVMYSPGKSFWLLEVMIWLLLVTSIINHGWNSNLYQWLDRVVASLVVIGLIFAHALYIQEVFNAGDLEMALKLFWNCTIHIAVIWMCFIMPRLLGVPSYVRTFLHLFIHIDGITFGRMCIIYHAWLAKQPVLLV